MIACRSPSGKSVNTGSDGARRNVRGVGLQRTLGLIALLGDARKSEMCAHGADAGTCASVHTSRPSRAGQWRHCARLGARLRMVSATRQTGVRSPAVSSPLVTSVLPRAVASVLARVLSSTRASQSPPTRGRGAASRSDFWSQSGTLGRGLAPPTPNLWAHAALVPNEPRLSICYQFLPHVGPLAKSPLPLFE